MAALGDYLLKGWTMIELGCEECNYPLMRMGKNTICVNQCKKKDVSVVLGEYLLKGYTMLQDSCVDCNIPLMRNHDKTMNICVGCNKEFILTKETLDIPKPVKVKSIEDHLGEYLLKGWTMLNESCSNCNIPLMKKNSSKICVACNYDFESSVNDPITGNFKNGSNQISSNTELPLTFDTPQPAFEKATLKDNMPNPTFEKATLKDDTPQPTFENAPLNEDMPIPTLEKVATDMPKLSNTIMNKIDYLVKQLKTSNDCIQNLCNTIMAGLETIHYFPKEQEFLLNIQQDIELALNEYNVKLLNCTDIQEMQTLFVQLKYCLELKSFIKTIE